MVLHIASDKKLHPKLLETSNITSSLGEILRKLVDLEEAMAQQIQPKAVGWRCGAGFITITIMHTRPT